MRVSETQWALESAKKADDRTRRGKTAVVTMRSRVRYEIVGGFELRSRKMSIRFFGYFAEHRYLAFRTLNWAFQISFRSSPFHPLVLHPLASLTYVLVAPLDPHLGPRRISHITFRNLQLSSSLFLLRLLILIRFKLYSRLSYLASFLDEDLSCGTLAASRSNQLIEL